MVAKHFPFWAAALGTLILGPAAGAGEIGDEISHLISSATYQHYLEDMLYTHDGDNRDGLSGPQHDLARDNVVATFESFGLPVELHAFTYTGGTHYNVIATKLGTRYFDSYYLISGHYDSVACPGADDNASGTAGVLEIARVLSGYPTEYTIKFVAFDMEEYGLDGSTAYVNDHITDDIRGMVSMDMVAWIGANYACTIWGRASSGTVKTHLAQALTLYGDGVIASIGGQRDSSDHASFERAGFQACHLREALGNANYHTVMDSADTPAYLDYAFAADMSRGVAGFLADQALAHRPGDCNDNGIPDDLEIQANPALDCDSNGRIDACEINSLTDCNSNGRLDVCDIADGISNDRNGNGVPDECEDQTPPFPNPMEFLRPEGLPHPISTTAVTMQAVQASDPYGVQYYFNATGVGSHSRDWSADFQYTDTGLQINRTYSYKVKARDLSVQKNETAYSEVVYVATFIETPTALTFGPVGATSIQVTAPGTFTRLSNNLSGLFFEVTRLDGTAVGGAQANAWGKTQTITASGLTPGLTYRFRVKARNYFGVNETPWFPVSGYRLQSLPARLGPLPMTGPDVSEQDLPRP